jgi:hypothetical protein
MQTSDVDVLMQTPGTPFYHKGFSLRNRKALRAHVLQLTGGMPRVAEEFTEFLAMYSKSSESSGDGMDICKFRKLVREASVMQSARKENTVSIVWINHRKPATSSELDDFVNTILSTIMSVLRETARLSSAVKILYDHGLVKRTGSVDDTVAPCSLIANEALCSTFACVQGSSAPSQRYLAGGARDIQLEMDIFRSIARHGVLKPEDNRWSISYTCVGIYPANLPYVDNFDSREHPYAILGASVILVTRHDDLRDVVALPGQRSLWIYAQPPMSPARSGGIVMPPLEKLGTESIVVFESSTAQPYDVQRRHHAAALCVQCELLQRRYPRARAPVPVVMWDGELASLQQSVDQDAIRSMPAGVMMIGRAGLRVLGVRSDESE